MVEPKIVMFDFWYPKCKHYNPDVEDKGVLNKYCKECIKVCVRSVSHKPINLLEKNKAKEV